MYVKLRWADQNGEAGQNEELLWITDGCSFEFFEGKLLKYKSHTSSMNLFRPVSSTQKTLKEEKYIPSSPYALIFWMEALGGNLTFIRLQKEKREFEQVLF